jgi:hypothetical protein
MLLRPGDRYVVQLPNQEAQNQSMRRKKEEFKKKLDETPLDDWPKRVLEEYIKEHPEWGESEEN